MHRKSKSDLKKVSLFPDIRYSYKIINASLRLQPNFCYNIKHGLRTPIEGINQRYLKNWADVAVKICFGRT